MKSCSSILLVALCLLASACGSSKESGPDIPPAVAGLTNGSTLTPLSGPNVMNLTINGSTCSAGSYANKPCVSVTICEPGTTGASNCTTVNDILVDTGSYGLRVFQSAISARTLNPVTSRQGGALTECAKFGDGSVEWGPVKTASVILGTEAAVQVPIQVIDPSFGSIPSSCGTPDASASAAGFNGILGLGLFNEDCGAGCLTSHTANGMYFSCAGSGTGFGSGTATCVGGSTNTLADQVQNPVSALPVDNNGVIIELPSISGNGASSVSGYLVLGIGTQANNTPGSITTYPASPTTATFKTSFNGTSRTSFLDSGSNGLYFPQPSGLSTCQASTSFYCPSTIQTFSAVNSGTAGSPSGTVNFQVGNAATLFNSGNRVFNNLAGTSSSQIDYGLPFYFGRNIYVGIEQKVSTLGTGPYWAY